MKWCLCGVFLVICGLQIGECTSSNTVPEPGTVIGGVLGTVNISLYCEFINDNNITLATNWFKQTPEDRQNNRLQAIVSGNDAFIITGDILFSDGLEIPQQSNLTILLLTEDLDDVVIYCGVADADVGFTLRIYYPPVLLDQGEVVIRENEELSLDMRDPDSPPAFPFPSQYMWTRQNDVVNSMENRVFNYSSIFIGSVEPSDTGTYTLTATNYELDGVTLFGTDSDSITLNVLFGAGLTIPVGSESVVVLEGDSVTLVCGTDLTGNPIPNITWTDNNGSEVFQGGIYILSGGRDIVSLTLNSSVRGYTGEWTCSAQVYESGTTLTVGQPMERTLQLVVVAVPEVPVDLYLVEVGATWISFGWFLSNDPYLSHHVISVLNVKEGEVINRTFEGSQPAVNVTDLLPGIEYNFTVVAVAVFEDIEAASLPSRPFSSTTSITVPAPVCNESPRVTDDRLIVTWTYIHTGGLPITSADVLFKPDTSSHSTLAFSSISGVELDVLSAINREDSIPLPEAGLYYQFTVRAGNSEGMSDTECPSLRLDIGIPSRPGPPVVSGSDNPVTVVVTTEHSGVRDSAVDEFHFILEIINVDDSSQPIVLSLSVESCGVAECTHTETFNSSDGRLEEGVTYIVSAMAVNRYGESQASGNSDPFTFGTTSDGDSESNSSGVIVGGIIGALVIVILIVLIIILGVFIFLKRRSTVESYRVSGGQGVRVEEVDDIDLGRQLGDPNKELHYAELEQFQKPDIVPGHEHNNNNIDNLLLRDEPVQYATLQEIKPKATTVNSSSGGEGGGGETSEGGGGEGDKALTSSTFV